MRWFLSIFLVVLLVVSIGPFFSGVRGKPGENPFGVLEWDCRFDPLSYRWPFLLAAAWKAEGEYEKAERYLKRSIFLNPLDPSAWIALSDVFLEKGLKEEALHFLENSIFLDSTSAYVRWRVLLRLMTYGTSRTSPMVKNQIAQLIYLEPSKRDKLFELARMVSGSDNIDSYVPNDRDSWRAYLVWQLRRGDPSHVKAMWESMKGKGWTDERLFRYTVNGLIAKKRCEDAWSIWREWFSQDGPIHNGGFEKDIVNCGFGWRWNPHIEGLKSWGYSRSYKVEGRRSFFMEFDGDHNPYVGYPRQLVFIDKPGRYRLSVFIRTEDVTGATGFSVEVWGKGFRARSEEVKGYTPWKLVNLEFCVREIGVIWVAFIRRKTKKLNKFLGGNIWIDQVTLERVGEEEASKRSAE